MPQNKMECETEVGVTVVGRPAERSDLCGEGGGRQEPKIGRRL